jgi:hypothetical protein
VTPRESPRESPRGPEPERPKKPRKRTPNRTGLSQVAWRILRIVVRQEGSLAAYRTYPHPYHYTLTVYATDRSPTRAEVVTEAVISAMVQAGVIESEHAALDRLSFTATERGAVAVRMKSLQPPVYRQLDLLESEEAR